MGYTYSVFIFFGQLAFKFNVTVGFIDFGGDFSDP